MNNISDFDAHKRDEEFDAAEDRRKERKAAMSYSRTIIVSETEKEALGYILDLAHGDQEAYLSNGDVNADYGEEWTAVAIEKARMFRGIAAFTKKLGLNGEIERWNALAETVLSTLEESEA